MKFYSEELKKLFDSEEELRKAEKAHRVEHNKKMKIMNEIETHFTAACDEFDIVFKKLEEVNDIMTDEEATMYGI